VVSLRSWRAAAIIASWTTAALRGRVGVDQVLDVLAASDLTSSIHQDGEPRPTSLVLAMARWRAAGITGWWYAPVEPGDVVGLPSPLKRRAIDAAVVSVDGVGRALLLGDPLLEIEVAGHGQPPAESVADAERHLLATVSAATDAMSELDVVPWLSPDGEGPNLEQLLDQQFDPLPPGLDRRAERLAERSLRVLQVTGAALRDDGGSRTSFEVSHRAEALREVRRAARRAHAVAWNTGVSSRPRAR
jgi:hypothetical protein